MGKAILILMVVLLLIVGMGSMAYILFSSTIILPRLSNATESIGYYQSGSKVSFFDLGRIYYHSTDIVSNTTNKSRSICNTTIRKQIVIVEVIFNTSRIPDSCEIFVDNRVEKHVKLYDLPYKATNQELKQVIDLKKQDIFVDHIIMVCCNNICLNQKLPAQCS